jgi:FAD binding domain
LPFAGCARPLEAIDTMSITNRTEREDRVMTDLRVIRTDGGDEILEEAAVHDFAANLRGRLLRPGDGGYDEARKVWNGMIDRHPALIARCSGVADVIAAVRFAREHEHELLVSIRGGGHNITGNAVCEGGLMIDLSPMKSVRVDPAKRVARAEAGLTWGEYNRETQAFGLASTGGVVSTTGIAGLTLGGGLGWLMGKHGLSCDNLLSADLVTAEGQFLKASAQKSTRISSGGCAAAAGILVWSRRSNTSCIRSARCSPAWSSIRSPRPRRCSAFTATFAAAVLTRWSLPAR